MIFSVLYLLISLAFAGAYLGYRRREFQKVYVGGLGPYKVGYSPEDYIEAVVYAIVIGLMWPVVALTFVLYWLGKLTLG